MFCDSNMLEVLFIQLGKRPDLIRKNHFTILHFEYFFINMFRIGTSDRTLAITVYGAMSKERRIASAFLSDNIHQALHLAVLFRVFFEVLQFMIRSLKLIIQATMFIDFKSYFNALRIWSTKFFQFLLANRKYR